MVLVKWVSQDMDMFLGAREYVDTAVLPLFPVSFGNDIKQSVAMTEFIQLLTIPLERQFKGRMIMLPGHSYLKNKSKETLLEEVIVWEKELFDNGFKHVFFVTSDSIWKSLEGELKGGLIWLPSIPLAAMDEGARTNILEDQVKQLLQLFMQKWQEDV